MLEGKHLQFLTQGLLAVVILVRVSQAQPSPQQPASVRLLDVMRVSVDGDPKACISHVTVPSQPPTFTCDILVAGGGTGGVAAALTAARAGRTVCLTEETDWLGGQFTAQGVAAFDDHRFIEEAGGTASYYDLRQRIRAAYTEHYKLSKLGKDLKHFNPGNCYVSPLCFEPAVGVEVVNQLVAPHLKSKKIHLFLRTAVFWLEVRDKQIHSALAYRFDRRDVIRIQPQYVLDATELGDLLPLAAVPYFSGSESRAQTGESRAPAEANPDCVQSITYTFGLEHRPGEKHVIPKTPEYERLREAQPYALAKNFPKDRGWKGEVTYKMFGEDPPIPHTGASRSFFPWRRLIDHRLFDDRRHSTDIALINWFSNDYRFESIIDRTVDEQARYLQEAKRLSLGFVHWLQTEAPRDDGDGKGYPELKLRPDVMGSTDGLSKYPYIRESRRLRALRQVLHEDTGISFHKSVRARRFEDSIGLGLYMIDIHGCGKGEKGVDEPARPFQVPLRSLLSASSRNLIAAGKNLGVTHITNGTYRMHPVEWNIGEAAATLASFALTQGVDPHRVAGDSKLLVLYQQQLIQNGIPLVWFDDLKSNHPAFAAVQRLALAGHYPMSDLHLHASPDALITRGEAALMLAKIFAPADLRKAFTPIFDLWPEHPHAVAAQTAVERNWMILDHRNWFHADEPLFWGDLHMEQLPLPQATAPFDRFRPVSRGEFSRWLVELVK